MINKAVVVSLAVLALCCEYYAVDSQNKELEKEKYKLVSILNEMDAIDLKTEPTRYETASKVYGIDPKLLEAIERLETGNFTSEVFKENNNAYGGRYKGEYLKYDNHYQSTMELARLLKFSYFNKGITDLYEIGKTYCPDDSLWADKVMEIYDGLLKEEKNEQIQRRN